MARNNYTPPSNQTSIAADGSGASTVPGGSSGVVAPTVPAEPVVVARDRSVNIDPPKRWRVVNGGHVMLDGMRVPMRVGKEVDEGQYDISLLRRQGIRFEEIVEE